MRRLLLATVLFFAASVAAQIDLTGVGSSSYQCIKVGAPDELQSSHSQLHTAIESCQNLKLADMDAEYEVVAIQRIRIAFSEAAAAVLSYQLSPNDASSTCGSVLTTEYADGSCPLSSASCSTFTCVSPLNGEIDEVSTTAVDFSSNSVNGVAADRAYQAQPDSGDIQVEANIPVLYAGYTETATACGAGIEEGPDADDYVAYVAFRHDGTSQFTYGDRNNTTTVNGGVITRPERAYVTYDQSAGTLAGWHSDDDVNFTQIGSDVSQTLACDSGNCRGYTYCTSHDSAGTTFVSVTNIDISTTLTATAGGGTASEDHMVWAGDFRDGNFLQWHTVSDPNTVLFFQMPPYGRPIQYGGQAQTGNGDLAELVRSSASGIYAQGPTRGNSDYSVQFTVKSPNNETEPDDCDGGSNCSQRRSQITMQSAMEPNYGALCYLCERWIGFSIYLEADQHFGGGSFGPQFWEVKPRQDGGMGDVFGIGLNNTGGGSWSISHNWASGEPSGFPPAAQQMRYRVDYPTSGDWPDGLDHFPNASSQAALGDVNLGGWTDWVIHVKFDDKGSGAGGTGILDMWKRNEGGSWVKVLEIRPGSTTRGGSTFNHGIAVGAAGGFGPKIGPYMSSSEMSGETSNMVINIANFRIFDENASFTDATPDGSSPP